MMIIMTSNSMHLAIMMFRMTIRSSQSRKSPHMTPPKTNTNNIKKITTQSNLTIQNDNLVSSISHIPVIYQATVSVLNYHVA